MVSLCLFVLSFMMNVEINWYWAINVNWALTHIYILCGQPMQMFEIFSCEKYTALDYGMLSNGEQTGPSDRCRADDVSLFSINSLSVFEIAILMAK